MAKEGIIESTFYSPEFLTAFAVRLTRAGAPLYRELQEVECECQRIQPHLSKLKQKFKEYNQKKQAGEATRRHLALLPKLQTTICREQVKQTAREQRLQHCMQKLTPIVCLLAEIFRCLSAHHAPSTSVGRYTLHIADVPSGGVADRDETCRQEERAHRKVIP